MGIEARNQGETKKGTQYGEAIFRGAIVKKRRKDNIHRIIHVERFLFLLFYLFNTGQMIIKHI